MTLSSIQYIRLFLAFAITFSLTQATLVSHCHRELHQFFLGTISIARMEKLVNVYFGDNNGDFMAELGIMLDKDILTERRGQIEICSHLDQYHEGARVFINLKKKFNITANFDDLERILESVSIQYPFKYDKL